jgi:hypothetical protein
MNDSSNSDRRPRRSKQQLTIGRLPKPVQLALFLAGFIPTIAIVLFFATPLRCLIDHRLTDIHVGFAVSFTMTLPVLDYTSQSSATRRSTEHFRRPRIEPPQ